MKAGGRHHEDAEDAQADQAIHHIVWNRRETAEDKSKQKGECKNKRQAQYGVSLIE